MLKEEKKQENEKAFGDNSKFHKEQEEHNSFVKVVQKGKHLELNLKEIVLSNFNAIAFWLFGIYKFS